MTDDREELANELDQDAWTAIRVGLAEAGATASTTYEALSERTRRIRHNQFLGHADAVLASDWLARREAATRAATRREIAEEMCDCKDHDSPPTNPHTHQRIAHHCDCQTVILTSAPDANGVRHDHDCSPLGAAVLESTVERQ